MISGGLPPWGGYLSKPVHETELLAVVRKLMPA
jgi:hypothetical protein